MKKSFPSAKSAGFKLAFSQDSEAMLHILDDVNIKKIILYRENILSVWSSLELAKKTGVFHLRQSGGSNNKRSKIYEKHRVKLEFSRRRFLKFINSYEAAYKSVREYLNSRSQAYIEVNYADLFNGKAFPRLEKFLGLSHLFNRDRQHTLKINSANPLDRFTKSNGAANNRIKFYWVCRDQSCLAQINMSAIQKKPDLRKQEFEPKSGFLVSTAEGE